MIDSNEVDRVAIELGIHSSNVQRDYIFGWLLSGIYSFSKFRDILILKGGNALRKAYLPNARFSEDLDFTTETSIDEEMLLNELNNVCRYIQEKTGILFDYNQNEIADERIIRGHKKVIKVKLCFRDFYGQKSEMTLKVRVDVTEFDKIYLPTQKRLLIHPYSDLASCSQEITAIKLEEAMADKLKCLIQRRSSYDLFDLVHAVFVNNELNVNKSEIVTTFLKKSIFEPSPLAAKNLLLGIPFDFFKLYWEKHIACPSESRLEFSHAIELLKNGLEEIFANFSYGAHNVIAYYPSEIRNYIMEAGRSMTLLRVSYDGYERIVEPYSLVYKRREDGLAQEYFYVWDRTGGKHGPGIKAFLHTGIQFIENTDERFEPRYEVEITKSGDPASNSYFSKPFNKNSSKISRMKPIRIRSNYTQGKFTLECAVCKKRFVRNTYTTRINEHKDKYGNRCYGQYGYIV